jgi:hypothetical protein
MNVQLKASSQPLVQGLQVQHHGCFSIKTMSKLGHSISGQHGKQVCMTTGCMLVSHRTISGGGVTVPVPEITGVATPTRPLVTATKAHNGTQHHHVGMWQLCLACWWITCTGTALAMLYTVLVLAGFKKIRNQVCN